MATLASSSTLFGSQALSQVLKAVILGSYTSHLDVSFSIPQLSCIAANVYLAYKVHLTVRITILLSTTRIANISALCLLQCPSFTGHQQRLPCTILQGRARVAPRSLHDIFGPFTNCTKLYPRKNLLALYYVRTKKNRHSSRLPPCKSVHTPTRKAPPVCILALECLKRALSGFDQQLHKDMYPLTSAAYIRRY